MMMMMVCRRRRTQSGSLRALNFGFPTLRLAIIFIIIVIVTIIIVVVMAFGLFQSYRNPTMLGSPRTWALHKLYLSSTWELLARCLCLTVWGLLGNTWAPLGDCLVTTRPLLGDCLVIGATWWPLWESNWEHSLTIDRAYSPLLVFVCVYLYLYVQEGGTVPPPFNIIPTPKSLFYVLAWLRRNCFSKACVFLQIHHVVHFKIFD